MDADGWQGLLRDLRRAYSELREEVERRGTSSEEAFEGAVAAVAHCAYHPGAVRQKVALLRNR